MLKKILLGCIIVALSACAAVKSNLHVITAVAGNHGKITPGGDVAVYNRTDRAFVMLPDDGYRVDDVRIDGKSIGVVYSYKFSQVDQGHTIAVTFTLDTEDRNSKPATLTVPVPIPLVKAPVMHDLEEPKVSARKEAESTKATKAIAVTDTDNGESVMASRATTNKSSAQLDAISDTSVKGKAIAEEMDDRDSGFHDYTADMVMELTNSHGDQVTRYMKYRHLEMKNDGDRSMVLFQRPEDIRGTALLTHEHLKADDDQWLYLPSVKRVKRISSSNKSGSFMGSEFAYEDLSGQAPDKYVYRWLKDEACGELQCYVVEAVPRDPRSGYSKQIRWIDKKNILLRKQEYYDLKKSMLKTLVLTGYKKSESGFWRAETYDMRNHQSNKQTQLLWKNIQFGAGLTERDLSQSSLQ